MAIAGDTQRAYAGDSLPQRLVVRATCGAGRPLAGAWVRWSVLSGSAALNADSTQTDADGSGTVGVVLGNAPGEVRLQGALAGVPAVQFTATAVDRCTPLLPLVVGDSIQRRLRSIDCGLSDAFFLYPQSPHQLFPLHLAATGAVRLRLDAADFSPRLSLGSGSTATASRLLLERNAIGGGVVARVVLPAGDYLVAAGTPGDLGPAPRFTLSAAAVPVESTCEPLYTVWPVSFQGILSANACHGTREDYLVRMYAGESITAVLRSSAFVPDLGFARSNGSGWSILKGGTTTAPGEQTVTWTAATTDWYVVLVNWNGDPARTGSYSLELR